MQGHHGMMMRPDMMMGCCAPNPALLFTIKIILVLMGFCCLLVLMVRLREIIKVLKEIRDKK